MVECRVALSLLVDKQGLIWSCNPLELKVMATRYYYVYPNRNRTAVFHHYLQDLTFSLVSNWSLHAPKQQVCFICRKYREMMEAMRSVCYRISSIPRWIKLPVYIVIQTMLYWSTVHTLPEKLENSTIIGHFAFVFEYNSGSGRSSDHNVVVYEKHCFLKCFRPD